MTERYYSLDPDQPPSDAELYIDLELHRAEAEDRNINDAAAKLIAAALHTGETSSFYSLASSGAVDYEGLAAEIHRDYVNPRTPSWMRAWLNHLGTYAVEHDGRGMQPGWHELTRGDHLKHLLGEAGIAGADDLTELDTYLLGDRSLRLWHDYLTHEAGEMGMPTGHLQVPGSRYGRTTEDCSWWAIAVAVAQPLSEADDPEAAIDALMTMVVGDNEDIAAVVQENRDAIPEAVLEHLDQGELTDEASPDADDGLPADTRFDSPRDAALCLMALGGWACGSTGAVHSRLGSTWWMSNSAAELSEILTDFQERFAAVGLTDYEQLLGHWVVGYLSGFVDVLGFQTEDDVNSAYQRVEALHQRMQRQV